MLIKVLEVVDNRKSYTNTCKNGLSGCIFSLEEVFVNSNFIVKIEKNHKMYENVQKGYFEDFLEKTKIEKPHYFTDIVISDGSQNRTTLTIAGPPELILTELGEINRLAHNAKQLLHG